MTNESELNQVELVFEGVDETSTEGFVSKGPKEKLVKGFAGSIDNISKWFDKYQVDSIELWIKGAVETGGIVKLFVSASGEGGMKVTLTPKNQ
ncbi:MAG: hypothetical protein OEM79_02415 [Nitrosopumilus sp.]|nr:hypothetical protein [Nitrosopumilus sp.]